MVAELANHHNAYNELGPIGGLIASLGNDSKSFVLVIQHHDSTQEDEFNLKIFNNNDGSVDNHVPTV